MTATTTLRLELLKFYENLFPDDSSGFRDTSGWKCHFAKNYTQSISKSEIRWFVAETLIRMKVDGRYLKEDYVKMVVDSIYVNYKFTIDDESIAFVLKSKTEMDRDDDSDSDISIMKKVFRFISSERKKKKLKKTLDALKLD